MERVVGKVLEIFIPGEEDEYFDIFNTSDIGYKVQVDNEVIEVIMDSYEHLCNIYVEDMVIITKEEGKVVDIELYKGE